MFRVRRFGSTDNDRVPARACNCSIRAGGGDAIGKDIEGGYSRGYIFSLIPCEDDCGERGIKMANASNGTVLPGVPHIQSMLGNIHCGVRVSNQPRLHTHLGDAGGLCE